VRKKEEGAKQTCNFDLNRPRKIIFALNRRERRQGEVARLSQRTSLAIAAASSDRSPLTIPRSRDNTIESYITPENSASDSADRRRNKTHMTHLRFLCRKTLTFEKLKLLAYIKAEWSRGRRDCLRVAQKEKEEETNAAGYHDLHLLARFSSRRFV